MTPLPNTDVGELVTRCVGEHLQASSAAIRDLIAGLSLSPEVVMERRAQELICRYVGISSQSRKAAAAVMDELRATGGSCTAAQLADWIAQVCQSSPPRRCEAAGEAVHAEFSDGVFNPTNLIAEVIHRRGKSTPLAMREAAVFELAQKLVGRFRYRI